MSCGGGVVRKYYSAIGAVRRRWRIVSANMYNRFVPETSVSAGFAMPAEWEAHAACWMGWPCRAQSFPGAAMQEARAAYSVIARCIAAFEPVMMIARPADAAAARRLLGGAATVVEWPIDDSWLRDSGPTFVGNAAGEIAGVDWRFNAWGQKHTSFAADDKVAARVLQHTKARRFTAPLVMEGGSFHSDGQGTILTTEQCLLHPNRNPSMSRGQIEQALKEHLGAQKVLWLAGDLRDDETDGHVDNIACFAAPATVLAMEAAGDGTLQDNICRLREARDAHGRPLNLILLPRPQVRENGEDLLASYVNFYFANGGIVMPSFGVKEDAVAKAVLAEVFPQRKITQTPALAVVRGGGGIHCITQQQPA